MWILRTAGDGGSEQSEQVFRVLPGHTRTLGRATGADFILDAALVSRVHCQVTALLSGGLELKDLDSTNGTFVNGARVQQARIEPGDRIQIGRIELVASEEAPAGGPTAAHSPSTPE